MMSRSQSRLLSVLAVVVVVIQRPTASPASATAEPPHPGRHPAPEKAGTQRIYQGPLKGSIAIEAGFGTVGTQARWQIRIRDLELGEWDGMRARASFRSFSTSGYRNDDFRLLQALVGQPPRVVPSPLGQSFLPVPEDLAPVRLPAKVRVGQVWTRMEAPWWLPHSVAPLRYRVVETRPEGGRPCWVVARELPDHLTGRELKQYDERFWIDRSDGQLVRYRWQIDGRLPLALGAAMRFDGLSLDLTLQSSSPATPAEIAHAREMTRRLLALWNRTESLKSQPAESAAALAGWQTLADQAQEWVNAETDPDWRAVLASQQQSLGWAVTGARQKQMDTQLAQGKRPPAPEFALQDTEGQTHHVSDYKGKIVLLNFFGVG
jgi:AhpC/TSA family